MFSLFKHIDIDCVYQLKTSSIFLPVLHVYLLAFLRCLYQSQIITLKQELVHSPYSNIKYIDNQLVTVIKIQMICKCKYKTI